MRTRQVGGARPASGREMRGRRGWSLLAAWLVGAVAAGCGAVEEPGLSSAVEPERRTQELTVGNGISVNGISVNGLSINGISVNGISVNGLSSSEFHAWFQEDTAHADMVMRYIVRCAVPAGETRSYTDPGTGMSYTWEGLLGLAPDWAQGQAATVAEQQLVSACLAAHANKHGVHINISVLGRDARGQAIPYTAEELSAYSKREGCFFGNLFNGEGVYVGHDQGLLTGAESSLRACALSPGLLQMENACPPLVPVGNCGLLCALDASLTYYTSCFFNGVSYRPITTRMRPGDIYRCGDGICQSTESCGLGLTYNNCSLDCGICL